MGGTEKRVQFLLIYRLGFITLINIDPAGEDQRDITEFLAQSREFPDALADMFGLIAGVDSPLITSLTVTMV